MVSINISLKAGNILYRELLQQWCDCLIEYQLKGIGDLFDGGFICPACKGIHGRSADAVYPLLCAAELFGESKYITAAKAVMRWQKNMLCDDGSIYNDPNSVWNGITVFASISLCSALKYYPHLLDSETKNEWETRLSGMCEWLYMNLHPGKLDPSINYMAANAASMAMAGNYFSNENYRLRARELCRYMLSHVSENGLIYGEGHGSEEVSEGGCRPVDIGYNMEETLPSLVKYALELNDSDSLEKIKEIMRAHLPFLLPDGAIDNSFGIRNNKWTYYGSRTSDGLQGAYALLAKDEPVFARSAFLSTKLMTECSGGGLLAGGMQYTENGEPPCIHHTITHANAIAAAITHGIEEVKDMQMLPNEKDGNETKFYKEINTYRIKRGKMLADITGYDLKLENGHVSGGAMTLLYHEKAGAIIASSVLEYRLVEPNNMQLPLLKKRHRPLVARYEFYEGKHLFTNVYDKKAEISIEEHENETVVRVKAKLLQMQQKSPEKGAECTLIYYIRENEVEIKGEISGNKQNFILPLISKNVKLVTENKYQTDNIFFLTAGFSATEYTIEPDDSGAFKAVIQLISS